MFKTDFSEQNNIWIFVGVLWIHKGYFLDKKLVLNIHIKAFWYTNKHKAYSQRLYFKKYFRRKTRHGECNRGTAGFAYVGGACVVNKRLEKVNIKYYVGGACVVNKRLEKVNIKIINIWNTSSIYLWGFLMLKAP